jgi:hypothetical protein
VAAQSHSSPLRFDDPLIDMQSANLCNTHTHINNVTISILTLPWPTFGMDDSREIARIACTYALLPCRHTPSVFGLKL